MIISRTPLRISFAGGGSDIPNYYLNNYGTVISCGINKYIYVILKKDQLSLNINMLLNGIKMNFVTQSVKLNIQS